jgi:hypothetical protein
MADPEPSLEPDKLDRDRDLYQQNRQEVIAYLNDEALLEVRRVYSREE